MCKLVVEEKYIEEVEKVATITWLDIVQELDEQETHYLERREEVLKYYGL